jgi:hypothetical protein
VDTRSAVTANLSSSAAEDRVRATVAAPDARQTATRLLAYCRENNWAGYDPYDALNSEIFKALPILDFRLSRIGLTQVLKRSPFNIRPLLLIPKTQNPKGLALFLGASLKLAKLGLLEGEDLAGGFVDRLIALRSPGTPYWCWGYSFPWQTRTIVVRAGTPNLVCTVFVADALLDMYEQRGDARCLEMARSAADYIVNELYWAEGDTASLNYPLPGLGTRIHNANLLGAALLCRVAKHTGNRDLLGPALKVARYSASRQKPDGSWVYGELPKQQWIDNFHTGYNLAGLRAIGLHAGTSEFDSHVDRGFQFYLAHFIRDDGAPRYFHDNVYPIDVHCVSQSLITLMDFQDLDGRSVTQARAVFQWAMRHMWDARGYFYYRVTPFHTTRTPYMRWGQAWMLLAIATLIEKGGAD